MVKRKPSQPNQHVNKSDNDDGNSFTFPISINKLTIGGGSTKGVMNIFAGHTTDVDKRNKTNLD